MRKPKCVTRGFEIIQLEDSLEEDFECLESNSVDNTSSTHTNSSSDDDWSFVDDDVDDGDVIYSPSTSHLDGNGVDQRDQSWPTIGGGFSKKRLAHRKKKDIRARANKITPVDDWISLGKPSAPDLTVEEVPVTVDNFAADNSCKESDGRLLLNELGKSDEPDLCDDFIRHKNCSACELHLECVEFVVIERNENENHDIELDEFICSEDSNFAASVEMSDSVFENRREDSKAGEDLFEKEMLFPYVEIPEYEETIEDEILGTDERHEITNGEEVEPSADYFMIEEESSDEFFDSLIVPEGHCSNWSDVSGHCSNWSDVPGHCSNWSDVPGHCSNWSDVPGHCSNWSDPNTVLEIKCHEPENFLPNNDLYDFFPARYCPLKFDRYGSRHRKRQQRVLEADKCWTKMYYYY